MPEDKTLSKKTSKYFWAEMTSPQLQQCAQDNFLVILPCGSTEQHGWHLPLDTDAHIISTVAQRVAERMGKVVVLPTLSYGFSPQHFNAAGTVTLSLLTYYSVIKDILRAVTHHGFKTMILLNGHGANEDPLRAFLRDLAREISMRILTVTYWFALDPSDVNAMRQGGLGSMGHAGELETSVQLYLRPHLVEMEQAVSNPVKPLLKHLWADLFSPGHALMMDGLEKSSGPKVAGNALLGSSEKGKKAVNLVVDKLIEYFNSFKDLN